MFSLPLTHMSTQRHRCIRKKLVCGVPCLVGESLIHSFSLPQLLVIASTITGDAYREIIFQFVANLNKDQVGSWFQQDNARPRVTVETMELLRSFFGNRLIFAHLWPPQSPDLSPLDFFMRRYLKDRVYCTATATLAELRTRMVEKSIKSIVRC